MQQKRSKDQIIIQILDTCRGGANKTMVVYRAGLNFTTVVPHLALLQEKGFLEVKPGSRIVYKTTQAGERAIETLREARAIYS
jgi:predicted transcriptional regulator